MDERSHFWPCVVAGGMLLAALLPWPYGYYQLLRLVVCLAGAFVAWRAWPRHPRLMWGFAFLALLFNPLAPVHLSREIWTPINLAGAGMFFYGAAQRLEASQGRNGHDGDGM